MGNLGRLVCAYCLLKDDMPIVSGSYMIEVNDYIENSVLFFFFKKLRKMGPTISWLITMLPSLIARRWVGRQTL